ncbi:MAG: ribosome biogenesis GTP-binding protein YihA/YsxC [Proteobacteria bacterium]|nr:ribosome biogenesis GTP-binding protein YihA/YsxC [Pseudomonadota bacterium]
MSEQKPDFTEAGRKLFARECEFYWAAAKKDGLPPPRGIEIAFAGRSNVGKSSLINALTGRNGLARTSNTPGRTQELNFFDIAGAFSIVDMPGYGFAAVGKEKVSAWTGLIHEYLRGRVQLARVLLLIDARHGIKETDKPILDTLGKSAVSYQVVLTKADALGAAEAQKRKEEVAAIVRKHAAAHPEIILTSSRENEGVAELRASIAALLYDRGALPEWALA